MTAIAMCVSALLSGQPASAGTSCTAARQAAIASAISSGDVSLAAAAKSMCSSPCESIYSFYRKFNISDYVEGLIFDAYRSCLAGNSGGTTCKEKTFKKVQSPRIKGTAKTGYLLEDDSFFNTYKTFSPEPDGAEIKYYRGGRMIPFFEVLTDKDLGKQYSIKVTVYRDCYKSASAWSKKTKPVTKGNLPKLKAGLVKLNYHPPLEGDDGGQLRFDSKYENLMFESGPNWVWVGQTSSKWVKSSAGRRGIDLPDTAWVDEYGRKDWDCINGRTYKIGATAVVFVPNLFSPTKFTFQPKNFVCVSELNL